MHVEKAHSMTGMEQLIPYNDFVRRTQPHRGTRQKQEQAKRPTAKHLRNGC